MDYAYNPKVLKNDNGYILECNYKNEKATQHIELLIKGEIPAITLNEKLNNHRLQDGGC